MQNTADLATSSWEAFRLTSKSPSELMSVLGPHAVDELVRRVLAACWRDTPAEDRSLETVKKRAREVLARNLRVWSAIKKPSPAQFFQDLLPYPADGYMRQAMVLCWMMMPRGRRSLEQVRKVVTRVFDRDIEAWDEDFRVLSKGFAPAKKSTSAKRGKRKR